MLFTAGLTQPFAVLLPHVATTGEEPRGSRPYPSPLLYTMHSCFLLKKHGGLPLLLQKSPVQGGKPVKGTEKLMQYRLGA